MTKPAWSTRKKWLLGIGIFLLVMVVAVVVYIAVMFSRINYTKLEETTPSQTLVGTAESESPTPLPTDELADSEIDLQEGMEQTELSAEEMARLQQNTEDNSVTNVLLMGIDRRGQEGYGNSDTMLIGTLDQPHGRLKLTSIMRDLYVDIPGRGGNRINSALSNGGVSLLLKTINQNFETDLQYYVIIDFYMFEKAVDEVGGLTIEMTKGEVMEANDCIAGLNKQRGASLRDGFITQRDGGAITLTGKQALGYCRMRHYGEGDFSRTSRQAKALQALFDKVLSAGPLKQSSLLYNLLPMVETNLSPTQIASLSAKVLSIGNTEILHYRIPVQGLYRSTRVRGMYVLVPDVKANAQKLHWFLYEATEVEALEGSDTGKGSYHKIKEPKKTVVTAPPNAMLDENGKPLLDEKGNFLVAPESPSVGESAAPENTEAAEGQETKAASVKPSTDPSEGLDDGLVAVDEEQITTQEEQPATEEATAAQEKQPVPTPEAATTVEENPAA